MSQIHDNEFNFLKGIGTDPISFAYSGSYIVTEGQPWEGVVVEGSKITVKAGRHASKECATWYKNYIDNNAMHSVHTSGGDKMPNGLNFAIIGTLTINGTPYEICLGQGSNDSGNNWHLASKYLISDDDNKNASVQIRLAQDGNYAFNVITGK